MTDLRLVASHQLPFPDTSKRRKPRSTSTTSPVISPNRSPHGFDPSQRLYLHTDLNRLLTLQPESEPQLANIIRRMLAAAERIDAERNGAAEGQAEADREILLSGR